MLPKDLSKYSIYHIEKGFQTLKSENEARLQPLKELVSAGKPLTKADERFMDTTANLIDELKVVERIKEIGDVVRAAGEFNRAEKATLQVLILKANQSNPISSTKLNCQFVYPCTQNLMLEVHSQIDDVLILELNFR